ARPPPPAAAPPAAPPPRPHPSHPPGHSGPGAGDFIEQYTDWNQAEVWIIDTGGDVLMSSSGFPVQPEEMPDYQAAMEANDTGTWIGRMASGEKVFASTIIITGDTGSQIGAVRFITSLEAVDRQIRTIHLLFLGTVAALLGVVIFVSLRFLRSISTPVREIGDTAVKIAQADF
ncbi:MAG: cell wall metabolism sensor histidine kinase WalK, partial [Clostridiales bacterium]|nr:cell wall metabolism sensor histidine kinase WalK [Clostridiales bacterium]